MRFTRFFYINGYNFCEARFLSTFSKNAATNICKVFQSHFIRIVATNPAFIILKIILISDDAKPLSIQFIPIEIKSRIFIRACDSIQQVDNLVKKYYLDVQEPQSPEDASNIYLVLLLRIFVHTTHQQAEFASTSTAIRFFYKKI